MLPSETNPEILKLYLYTHKTFDILNNGNRIIEVNLTSENRVLVKETGNTEIKLTQEFFWFL